MQGRLSQNIDMKTFVLGNVDVFIERSDKSYPSFDIN